MQGSPMQRPGGFGAPVMQGGPMMAGQQPMPVMPGGQGQVAPGQVAPGRPQPMQNNIRRMMM